MALQRTSSDNRSPESSERRRRNHHFSGKVQIVDWSPGQSTHNASPKHTTWSAKTKPATDLCATKELIISRSDVQPPLTDIQPAATLAIDRWVSLRSYSLVDSNSPLRYPATVCRSGRTRFVPRHVATCRPNPPDLPGTVESLQKPLVKRQTSSCLTCTESKSPLITTPPDIRSRRWRLMAADVPHLATAMSSRLSLTVPALGEQCVARSSLH